MGTIIPHSELTKQAVAWVCQQREQCAGSFKLRQSIEEACIRFNLGPLDAEFLTRFFQEQEGQKGA